MLEIKEIASEEQEVNQDHLQSSTTQTKRELSGVIIEKSVVDMKKLEKRIGRVHLNQRLGIEADHATQIIGRGRTRFHIENWYLAHGLIRGALKCLGLYWWGRRNAVKIAIRHHEVAMVNLPEAFDGFTLLHLSDLHLDMQGNYPLALIERLQQVSYDLCVITGDLRAKTYGPFEAALTGLARVRPHLHQPIYAVLGNHDSIRMVPAMEEMGIRCLLNEAVALKRKGAVIYLAGIDDPHYYQVDNFEKAAQNIPSDAFSILLSHSPETYRLAAHAGFDLMLSGHTHGGQICLPGGIALMMNANCPRRYCVGAWRYQGMQGYTSVGSGSSVVEVRFNCAPEITLHHLRVLRS
jgi:predicted MPP superfamily phosphohydrolase